MLRGHSAGCEALPQTRFGDGTQKRSETGGSGLPSSARAVLGSAICREPPERQQLPGETGSDGDGALATALYRRTGTPNIGKKGLCPGARIVPGT